MSDEKLTPKPSKKKSAKRIAEIADSVKPIKVSTAEEVEVERSQLAEGKNEQAPSEAASDASLHPPSLSSISNISNALSRVFNRKNPEQPAPEATASEESVAAKLVLAPGHSSTGEATERVSEVKDTKRSFFSVLAEAAELRQSVPKEGEKSFWDEIASLGRKNSAADATALPAMLEEMLQGMSWINNSGERSLTGREWPILVMENLKGPHEQKSARQKKSWTASGWVDKSVGRSAAEKMDIEHSQLAEGKNEQAPSEAAGDALPPASDEQFLGVEKGASAIFSSVSDAFSQAFNRGNIAQPAPEAVVLEEGAAAELTLVPQVKDAKHSLSVEAIGQHADLIRQVQCALQRCGRVWSPALSPRVPEQKLLPVVAPPEFKFIVTVDEKQYGFADKPWAQKWSRLVGSVLPTRGDKGGVPRKALTAQHAFTLEKVQAVFTKLLAGFQQDPYCQRFGFGMTDFYVFFHKPKRFLSYIEKLDQARSDAISSLVNLIEENQQLSVQLTARKEQLLTKHNAFLSRLMADSAEKTQLDELTTCLNQIVPHGECLQSAEKSLTLTAAEFAQLVERAKQLAELMVQAKGWMQAQQPEIEVALLRYTEARLQCMFEQQNESGALTLHAAIASSPADGGVAFVNLLDQHKQTIKRAGIIEEEVLNLPNDQGKTPLDLAVYLDEPICYEQLSKLGAQHGKCYSESLKQLKEWQLIIAQAAKNPMTLVEAISNPAALKELKWATVKQHIEADTFNQEDQQGLTPLDWAVKSENYSAYYWLAKKRARHGQHYQEMLDKINAEKVKARGGSIFSPGSASTSSSSSLSRFSLSAALSPSVLSLGRDLESAEQKEEKTVVAERGVVQVDQAKSSTLQAESRWSNYLKIVLNLLAMVSVITAWSVTPYLFIASIVLTASCVAFSGAKDSATPTFKNSKMAYKLSVGLLLAAGFFLSFLLFPIAVKLVLALKIVSTLFMVSASAAVLVAEWQRQVVAPDLPVSAGSGVLAEPPQGGVPDSPVSSESGMLVGERWQQEQQFKKFWQARPAHAIVKGDEFMDYCMGEGDMGLKERMLSYDKCSPGLIQPATAASYLTEESVRQPSGKMASRFFSQPQANGVVSQPSVPPSDDSAAAPLLS